MSEPINFGSPSVIGSADIVVDDTQTYQSVWGYGGSLSEHPPCILTHRVAETLAADSSASILSALKTNHASQYTTLMNTLFDRRSRHWLLLPPPYAFAHSYGWSPGCRSFFHSRTHWGFGFLCQRSVRLHWVERSELIGCITDYSLDDVSGDTSFSDFNINNQPSDVFDILSDIKAINRYLRVIIAPWSPPAWMKDSGTMNGGALETQYATQCAYL